MPQQTHSSAHLWWVKNQDWWVETSLKLLFNILSHSLFILFLYIHQTANMKSKWYLVYTMHNTRSFTLYTYHTIVTSNTEKNTKYRFEEVLNKHFPRKL
jgi:hypothetical protein